MKPRCQSPKHSCSIADLGNLYQGVYSCFNYCVYCLERRPESSLLFPDAPFFFFIEFCSLFHRCIIFYYITEGLSNILKISSSCIVSVSSEKPFPFLFVLVPIFQGRGQILLRKLFQSLDMLFIGLAFHFCEVQG